MKVERSAERALAEWTQYVNAYINYLKENEDDEDFYDDYWSNEQMSFGWEKSKTEPYTVRLIYELAVGGPNAHLVFFYRYELEPQYHPAIQIEFEKIEFQFHWWSPISILDLTKMPKNPPWETYRLFDTAYTCLEQIEEEAQRMLEENWEHILK